MNTPALFPSRRIAPAVASLARPGSIDKRASKRQALAALLKRQILNSGFGECARNPEKPRLEVFAKVVKSFDEALKPWGFVATSGPGPRSRGGVRVLVEPLE